MLSSSQDSGEVLSLTVGQFKQGCEMNHVGERFFWENSRAKTHKPFQSFFSVEATENIRAYLKSERPEAKDNEPLFTNTRGNAMRPSHLSENFWDCAKKIGIEWDTKVHQNPFRPKRTRHYFATCAKKADIDEFFLKVLMGHKLSMGEHYFENRAELEIVYTKIEPYLSIFTGTEQVQRVIKALIDTDERITELNQQILSLRIDKQEMNQMIEKQKAQMADLEKMVSVVQQPLIDTLTKMKDQMDTMREEMDSMRKSQEQKDQQVEKY
jgi:hypothetical protein